MADDERADPAPQEEYPGPRTAGDEGETQPGRTPELAEQERERPDEEDQAHT